MPREDIQGILVHVHQKGWMDENGMKLWIQKCGKLVQEDL